MRSPFPGMDPYLEAYWNDVHGKLVTYIADRLNDALPSRYRATLQDRVIIANFDAEQFTSRYPDVAVIDAPSATSSIATASAPRATVTQPAIIRYKSEPLTQYSVEVVDSKSGETVVTAIEVLSPENKRPGDGMLQFEQKQKEYRTAGVSRVNIDLLRAGFRFFDFPARLLKPEQVTPYYVTIYRGFQPEECGLYAIHLANQLPSIGIPLRAEDPEVTLELQPLIEQVYRTGRFPIDYTQPCDPPLEGRDAIGASELLAARQT